MGRGRAARAQGNLGSAGRGVGRRARGGGEAAVCRGVDVQRRAAPCSAMQLLWGPSCTLRRQARRGGLHVRLHGGAGCTRGRSAPPAAMVSRSGPRRSAGAPSSTAAQPAPTAAWPHRSGAGTAEVPVHSSSDASSSSSTGPRSAR